MTRTTRKKRNRKKQKNNQRNQVGFIETIKRRYDLLIKSREQIGGNSILQSRIIEKFNKMVNHVFANQNRKQKLRPCYLPQGGSLENSAIPQLFLNQISSATTSTKIITIENPKCLRQKDLVLQAIVGSRKSTIADDGVQCAPKDFSEDSEWEIEDSTSKCLE
ncbi:unnamed protein product [Oikopleura dioica]|nr:unnamed protein product [Oikopleura dioica]